MSLDLWGFVWLRPGLDASGLEWRECLGDDRWGVLRERLFACKGMANACQLHDMPYLILNSRRGIGLIHESSGQVLTWDLSESDARCYRVDPTVLRDMAAAALGISAEPGEVRDSPLCFPLGDWCPVHGISVPTFMMLPPTTKLLTSEIQRLLLRIHSGFILFVPQMPRLDAFLRDQLERHHAAVVSLQEMVVWNDVRFCATHAWQTYSQIYVTRHLAQCMPSPCPEYQFARKGMWAIRFAGKETFLEGTLKGPVYIRYLLAHQGEKIHVARMLSDIVGDERLALATDSGLAISPEELSCLKQRYNDLQTEKDQAVNCHDDGRLAAIEREMDQITSYIAPLLGLAGRSRKANDDVARIRRSIARVIGIAVEKITQNDPALGHHLSQSIKTHSYMSYEPEQRIEWNFE